MKKEIVEVILGNWYRVIGLVHGSISAIIACPPIQCCFIVDIFVAVCPWENCMKRVKEVKEAVDYDCCKVGAI